MTPAATPSSGRDGRIALRFGFTLTELMVAIAVLVGVLLASSKIFSTTSTVTRTGKAAADILQEAAAIEARMRDDIARMTHDGIFAIRCNAIENNINGDVLLNPNLRPDAKIRSDQLLFFANGVQSTHTFRIESESAHKGQGTVSRIYYGHAFQLGDAGEPFGDTAATDPFDLTQPTAAVFPWTTGTIGTVETIFEPGITIFRSRSPKTVEIEAPDARRWLFVRQPVLLADDDAELPDNQSKTVYLKDVISARSLFRIDPRSTLGPTPQIYHGRVDAAAMQLNDLRYVILWDEFDNGWREWSTPVPGSTDQYDLITQQLLYYPRAERVAPSMHRVDQALTNAVISGACSGVRIEWTYDDNVGAVNVDGCGSWPGIQLDYLEIPYVPGNSRPQPWFGLSDPEHPERGVGPLDDPVYQMDSEYRPLDEFPSTICPDNIEREYEPMPGVKTYEAVFGYNQERATVGCETCWDLDADLDPGYTPWPSAIRVTLTLHDPATTLEGGRDFQFVIDLPRPLGR